MGKALQLSCDCGYQKQVMVGKGIMAINLQRIRKVFADMDLSGFECAAAGGAKFAMGSAIACCAHCGEIMSAAVLRYTEDGKLNLLAKPCPSCGGKVTLRESAGDCPKCGKPLREQEIGLWD